MRTLLIATALVATSLSVFAGDNNYPPETAASGPGKTRAEVIAEFEAAKAAGQIQITEFDIRQAERLSLQQNLSTKTRQQVRQEVIAMRNRGELTIHGDR